MSRGIAGRDSFGPGTIPAQQARPALGILGKPSVTGTAWALLDIITALIASLIALRFRSDVAQSSGVLDAVGVREQLWGVFGLYLAWFAVCLVFFTRSYGIYGPIQNRSGLHEQRMTLQATLISGLILCGTVYLSRGEAVSRIVVILSVLLTGAMAVHPPRLVAFACVQPIPRGHRHPQRAHHRRGPRWPGAAQPPGIAPPSRLSLQGILSRCLKQRRSPANPTSSATSRTVFTSHAPSLSTKYFSPFPPTKTW